MTPLLLILAATTGFASSAHESPSLPGKWSTACTRLPEQRSFSVQAEFGRDGTLAAKTKIYMDDQCKSLHSTVDLRATYSTDHDFLDYFPTSVTMTLLNPRAVADYNANRICGISDWSKGASRDVSARYCDPTQMQTVDRFTPDLFSLARDGARFGAFPRAPAYRVRPLEIDPRIVFKKH